MSDRKIKLKNRIVRRKRIRAKIFGTARRPRMSVFKSNKHFYLQAIDDSVGKTLISVNDLKLHAKAKNTKNGIAVMLGELMGKRMKEKGILEVVFDKGGFSYRGRVKAAADSLRKIGIKL